ncbi:MAG: hypothetical protein AMXMBFR58_38850 [Phycisphaerae bacterium]
MPRYTDHCGAVITELFRRFRKPCRSCGDGRLQSRNWIRATMVNDAGERHPDSWTYYECDRCGARSKVFLDGRVEVPTTDEWQRHC